MTTKRQKQLAKERRRREWAEKSRAAKIFWIVFWVGISVCWFRTCASLIEPTLG